MFKEYCYMCPKCSHMVFLYEDCDNVEPPIICDECNSEMQFMGSKNVKEKYVPKPLQYEHINILNIPKCPTCHSTNIEKISFGKKAVGAGLFGIFSSDVRNTMHCKNCGYKW